MSQNRSERSKILGLAQQKRSVCTLHNGFVVIRFLSRGYFFGVCFVFSKFFWEIFWKETVQIRWLSCLQMIKGQQMAYVMLILIATRRRLLTLIAIGCPTWKGGGGSTWSCLSSVNLKDKSGTLVKSRNVSELPVGDILMLPLVFDWCKNLNNLSF